MNALEKQQALITKRKLSKLKVADINGLALPELIEQVRGLGVSKTTVAEASGVAFSTVYVAARRGVYRDSTEALVRQGILKLKKDGR